MRPHPIWILKCIQVFKNSVYLQKTQQLHYKDQTVNTLLRAFTMSWKALISFKMSVCLSVRALLSTRLALDGYSWNFVWETFIPNNRCLLWHSYETHKYTVGEKRNFLTLQHVRVVTTVPLVLVQMWHGSNHSRERGCANWGVVLTDLFRRLFEWYLKVGHDHLPWLVDHFRHVHKVAKNDY